MSAERPGGWVPGVGWVAREGDLPAGSLVSFYCNETTPDEAVECDDVMPESVCIVVRWADGSTPQAPDRTEQP